MGEFDRRRLSRVAVALIVVLAQAVAPRPAAAAGEFESQGSAPVAPGVEHDWGTVQTGSGRQMVHLVRVDTSEPVISLRTSLAFDMVAARELTTDQALDYSAEGHRVVAATNGSTFASWPAGHVAARGLNVRDGELLTAGRVADGPILSFATEQDGTAMVGQPTLDITVSLPNGSVGRLDRVNQGRFDGEGVLFTPRFDTHTWTDATGDEYVVDLDGLPIRPNGTWSGTVSAVRPAQGDSPIGPGQVVISVSGAAAAPFVGLVAGDQVTISLAIAPGWEGIYQAVGGRELLVLDGQVNIVPYRQTTTPNPRTAVGITATGQVLMLTVDGRAENSAGMTTLELAEFMISLGAVSALNLDGGGSTTMVVRQPGDVEASIVNTPSNGAERTVATTLQVISSAPTSDMVGLAVAPASASIQVGQSRQFVAKGYDAAYNGVPLDPANVRWSTSNDVAQVSAEGIVQGVSVGSSQVEARLANLRATADVTVATDLTAPVVSGPVASLRGDVQIGLKKARLAVSWSATDDSGVLGKVELQRRVGSGSWVSMALDSATATAAYSRVPFGRKVQFRARATDPSGNRSAWAVGPPIRVMLVDDRDAAIAWSGSWVTGTSIKSIGGTYGQGSGASSANLAFVGAQVGFVGLLGTAGGTTEIWQDGALVATLNQFSSSTQFRRVLFVSPRMDLAVPGSIEVRNPGSADTGPYAYLDAFLVLVPAAIP